MIAWIYFLFIFMSPSLISPASFRGPQFIIWNVGQGQWTTLVEFSTCFHFDAGGEFFPLTKISKICGTKNNQLYLSHWDWDHLSGLKKLTRWKNFCWMDLPELSSDTKKNELIQKFSKCTESQPIYIQKIFGGEQGVKTNAQSQVFVVRNILVSGDSLEAQERIWAHRLTTNIRGFVLGHHGSRSSNSDLILRHLPQLHWSVASARWKRYHHPHPSVGERLKQKKIPLLKTEDWGNIIFQLGFKFP